MYLFQKKFIILIVCSLLNNYGFAVKQRTKRNLLAMSDMISFTTGRYGLDFNKYGHFCGKGGKGQIMDSIDWCCNLHDNCYGRLQNYGCRHVLLSKYDWTLVNYQIVCPYVTTLKASTIPKKPKSTSDGIQEGWYISNKTVNIFTNIVHIIDGIYTKFYTHHLPKIIMQHSSLIFHYVMVFC
ncbi:PLA2G [Mytilus coruscus]|uniref:Phospholipase A2 n=1 Tax=Mytilus coruscus TaxID=42192 RepID=A0A6J8F4N2_MYTCO|nr:PLA2G [Mytilus coruscus]